MRFPVAAVGGPSAGRSIPLRSPTQGGRRAIWTRTATHPSLVVPGSPPPDSSTPRYPHPAVVGWNPNRVLRSTLFQRFVGVCPYENDCYLFRSNLKTVHMGNVCHRTEPTTSYKNGPSKVRSEKRPFLGRHSGSSGDSLVEQPRRNCPAVRCFFDII